MLKKIEIRKFSERRIQRLSETEGTVSKSRVSDFDRKKSRVPGNQSIFCSMGV